MLMILSMHYHKLLEAALPTWWTNKLAKCSAMMNGARDYLVYSDTPMEAPATNAVYFRRPS